MPGTKIFAVHRGHSEEKLSRVADISASNGKPSSLTSAEAEQIGGYPKTVGAEAMSHLHGISQRAASSLIAAIGAALCKNVEEIRKIKDRNRIS